MRSAGNFHPEWGYFAPVLSFRRTLRIAVAATEIGATDRLDRSRFTPAKDVSGVPPTAVTKSGPDIVPARKNPGRVHRSRVANSHKHPHHERRFAPSFRLPHNSRSFN